MFEQLSAKISKAIKRLRGQDRLTEHNIGPTLKEVRRALIEADVPYKLVKTFVGRVKEKALGQEIKISASPGQIFTKIVEDELASFMGSENTGFDLSGNPSVFVIAGLQGAGKTSFVGKLAYFFAKQGKKVLMTSCDVYRLAALEQLKVLSEQIEMPSYIDMEEKDPQVIVTKALAKAKEMHAKVLIVDTAGRQSIDEKMMDEVVALKDCLKPKETLFVVDAMTGQAATEVARVFDERLDFTGVVLTKMDGDTRGGAAIAVRQVTGKPLKMVSTGEKMMDLELFHPDRMARRILGMGDVTSLVERAEQVFEEEEMRKISKKIRQNKFDFNDLITQFNQMKKMGNISSLLGGIPFLGKLFGGGKVTFDEERLNPYYYMVQSMTPKEREHPELLRSNKSRRERIARGAGISEVDINTMLKQFFKMQQMAKKMNKPRALQSIMSKMK